MIRETTQARAWQHELRAAYRNPAELLATLGLDAADVGLSFEAARAFPFRVTRAYAARIRHGDAADPLLRQVLPVMAETAAVPGYIDDPVAEHGRLGHGSLLQKYAGRALVLAAAACAIHCRYCFRRHFPYAQSVGRGHLDEALRIIAASPELREIILSGGDPLMLDDDALGALLHALADIEHVERVRIHTRLPTVLPERMTAPLLALLGGQRYPVVMVVHVNHAREIDAATADALRRCREAGVHLLNQSVLLAGVNDSAGALEALSEALFAAGVLPYYMNVLDAVSGTAHFEVSDARALALEGELRARLPGYLVPRFVREVPGAAAKLPLRESGAAPDPAEVKAMEAGGRYCS